MAHRPPSNLEDIISAKLFVGNVSFDTTKAELEKLFGDIGEIAEVFLPTDRETGRPRGFAFVEFSDSSAATTATQRFDGFELNGRALRVNEAQERRPRTPSFNPNQGGPDFGGPSPFGGGGGGGGGGGSGGPGGPRGGAGKPKGSRRNLRRKKRSL
ncbi:MAG: RNA-binding protein [Candidatus Binatia bacterium]|nr:RNA-binding protein [Candidatus Binatia bacterium]